MARDAFQGAARGKVFATVAGAIAFAPIIGPVIGGYLDQTFGWPSIFLLLTIAACYVLIVSFQKLPETLPQHKQNKNSIWHVASLLLKDPRVLSAGFLTSASVAMTFVYYGEGSFYLIELLNLTPSLYGSTFIGIGLTGGLGALISRKLHVYFDSLTIMKYGIYITMFGGAFFVASLFVLKGIQASSEMLIFSTLLSMMILVGGTGLIISNALALALEGYTHITGTASAIFGCFYYALMSLFTFGMGILHNDTLYPLPLYLFAITLLMWRVYKMLADIECQRCVMGVAS